MIEMWDDEPPDISTIALQQFSGLGNPDIPLHQLQD
jgi:hypothetical protein